MLLSMNKEVTFAFFGTGALAESVLASLVRAGYMPTVVVTKPDAKQGRHMELTPPTIKVWAEMKGIQVLQPEKLDADFLHSLSTTNFTLFIVASYGKIIPQNILDLPSNGVLNVHPSLLPLYRGPSPIESVLLDGHMTTGVSIMKLDAQMDHGPILTQSAFMINPESNAGTLEVECGQLGGELLVQVLPHYLEGALIPKEQDHTKVTTCKKITKDLGLVHLDDDIDIVRRKFRALTPWPSLYFFIEHGGRDIRVKINQIDCITEKESRSVKEYVVSVTPEGKKQMDWESFTHGYMGSV